MDLALALGRRDVGDMPERQFSHWQFYSRVKGFPTRRLEFYLADISMKLDRLIAAVLKADMDIPSLRDYLFDPKRDERGQLSLPKEAKPEADLEAAKSAFGFKPRAKNG